MAITDRTESWAIALELIRAHGFDAFDVAMKRLHELISSQDEEGVDAHSQVLLRLIEFQQKPECSELRH